MPDKIAAVLMDELVAVYTLDEDTPTLVMLTILRGLVVLAKDRLTEHDSGHVWDALVDAEHALTSGLYVAEAMAAMSTEVGA